KVGGTSIFETERHHCIAVRTELNIHPLPKFQRRKRGKKEDMGEQWGEEDESHASLTISAQPNLYALNQILDATLLDASALCPYRRGRGLVYLSTESRPCPRWRGLAQSWWSWTDSLSMPSSLPLPPIAPQRRPHASSSVTWWMGEVFGLTGKHHK